MTEIVASSVTYDIELIGTIWMPPVLCATTRTYDQERTFATYSEKPDWNDPVKELEAIEGKLFTDTGDFQSVEDWRCVKVSKESYRENDDVIITRTTINVIKEWNTTENEMKFNDCMYHYDV